MKEIIDEVERRIEFWWYDNRRTIKSFLALWLKVAAYILLIFWTVYYAAKSADVPSYSDIIKLALCIITIIALFIYHIWWMDDDW